MIKYKTIDYYMENDSLYPGLPVKIKFLNKDAKVPSYATHGDAGLDLVATSFEYNPEKDVFVYHTGIALEIPYGYVGLVFPRSSIYKQDVFMTNHVGVIDSGYRGDILVTFKYRDRNMPYAPPYKVGDKIAQLIILPYPIINFIEVEHLNESERGTGGHGSTGK